MASNLPTEELAPPAPPRTVTIPEKTALTIRLGERLASDRSAAGDAFFGTLDAPLVVDGFVIADRGSRVLGRVTDIEAAGRVKGIGTLTAGALQFPQPPMDSASPCARHASCVRAIRRRRTTP